MFDPNSRYARIPTAIISGPYGRELVYVRRRFLPRSEDLSLLAEVPLSEGDRLDLLTARVLGDPEQFWRPCDASDAMNPADLSEPAGRTIRVPIPQPQ